MVVGLHINLLITLAHNEELVVDFDNQLFVICINHKRLIQIYPLDLLRHQSDIHVDHPVHIHMVILSFLSPHFNAIQFLQVIKNVIDSMFDTTPLKHVLKQVIVLIASE